jgi:hypothetical protein
LNAGRFRAWPVRQLFRSSDTARGAVTGDEDNKPLNLEGGPPMRKKLDMKLKAQMQYLPILAVLFGWTMFIVGNITGLPILVKLLLISVARALP